MLIRCSSAFQKGERKVMAGGWFHLYVNGVIHAVRNDVIAALGLGIGGRKRKHAPPHLPQEKERADMHAKIAAQKQEYVDRQAAAMRNKAAVEDNIRGPSAGRAGQPPQRRQQWQDLEPAAVPGRGDERDSRGTPPPAAGRGGAAGGQ